MAAGYHTYGVTEHCPRTDAAWLYDEEHRRGWTVATLHELFAAYTAELARLVPLYADRLVVLRGFECEVIPHEGYAELMRAWRDEGGFDYYVGSVHFVDSISIDGPMPLFEQALDGRGGLEPLAIRYYELVAEMALALRPEVVGHLDLIVKNGRFHGDCETPAIRRAALEALDAIAQVEGILDLNTAGWRKGLGRPYVAPWLLDAAKRVGVGVCFGDDSHRPSDVGAGIDESRAWLLTHGVDRVTVLTRDAGQVVRRQVPLAP